MIVGIVMIVMMFSSSGLLRLDNSMLNELI
jgi:hypothetical protein